MQNLEKLSTLKVQADENSKKLEEHLKRKEIKTKEFEMIKKDTMRKLKEGALAAQKESVESSVERLNWNGSAEGIKPE